MALDNERFEQSFALFFLSVMCLGIVAVSWWGIVVGKAVIQAWGK